MQRQSLVSCKEDNRHGNRKDRSNPDHRNHRGKEDAQQGDCDQDGSLILAIINNALAIFGKSPLPIDSETLTEVISFGFTTVAAFVTWWYNNSFTQKAIKADKENGLG